MKIQQLFESQADMHSIVAECSDFFSQTSSGLLFRGLSRAMYEPTKVTPRANRRPANTPAAWHDALDAAFEKKFGHRYRSSCIFAVGSVKAARAYVSSSLAIALPVNGMRFCWSPVIDDLYEYMLRALHSQETNIPDENERLDYCVQQMIATYQETDLQAGIDAGHEIMIATPVWIMPQQGRDIRDRIPEVRTELQSLLRT